MFLRNFSKHFVVSATTVVLVVCSSVIVTSIDFESTEVSEVFCSILSPILSNSSLSDLILCRDSEKKIFYIVISV